MSPLVRLLHHCQISAVYLLDKQALIKYRDIIHAKL